MRLLSPGDLDRLPLNTFLLGKASDYNGEIGRVARIVKPNDPSRYTEARLTPARRLVYVCWSRGSACKVLQNSHPSRWRIVSAPDSPGYAHLEAFKILCDTRRAMAGRPVETSDTLVQRALEEMRRAGSWPENEA